MYLLCSFQDITLFYLLWTLFSLFLIPSFYVEYWEILKVKMCSFCCVWTLSWPHCLPCTRCSDWLAFTIDTIFWLGFTVVPPTRTVQIEWLDLYKMREDHLCFAWCRIICMVTPLWNVVESYLISSYESNNKARKHFPFKFTNRVQVLWMTVLKCKNIIFICSGCWNKSALVLRALSMGFDPLCLCNPISYFSLASQLFLSYLIYDKK